jgi:hypothetical protein
MAIQFGNDKIKEIYVGSDKIKEVYYGSEKVWGGIKDGYWVHKDTGVKTYFGLEDPSIEDGIMGYPSWMPNCSEVKLPSGVTGFKTYNWVVETQFGNMEIAYIGFVHTKETYTAGNSVLISVDLSNTSITSIGAGCFGACVALTSITLPESVTSLGDSCFQNCSSLASINIPESVTSLGDSCFAYCSSLTSITLSDSVTILGEGCFFQCQSLTSITIPESVTSLGMGCFYRCTSLTLAMVLPATPPSIGEYVFYNVHTSLSIKVPSSSVNAYKTATNWNEYASIISAI